MDIYCVPEEVIEGSVLPYLECNDLLRFRRTCKWIKGIIDGYLRVHPKLAPELEIDKGEKNFEAFLKMGIPTTKIFINNYSGNDFYEEAGAPAAEFLEQFGTHIESLRVDQVSIYIYGKELDFLVGLKNLESFEAERSGGYCPDLPSRKVEKLLAQKKARFQGDQRGFRTIFP